MCLYLSQYFARYITPIVLCSCHLCLSSSYPIVSCIHPSPSLFPFIHLIVNTNTISFHVHLHFMFTPIHLLSSPSFYQIIILLATHPYFFLFQFHFGILSFLFPLPLFYGILIFVILIVSAFTLFPFPSLYLFHPDNSYSISIFSCHSYSMFMLCSFCLYPFC